MYTFYDISQKNELCDWHNFDNMDDNGFVPFDMHIRS